jgi:holo-[acyl-carrier protein] synthase
MNLAKALRTGVDIIEIERVHKAIDQHGKRFLDRVYTASEQELCSGQPASLAGRFAAKEAVSKALETGIWREGVTWTEIEILRAAGGAPYIALHGAAARRAEELGIQQCAISLSHDRSHAIAFVVAY